MIRIGYISRNAIAEPPEAFKREVDLILEVARRRNAQAGITGALVFNRGVFGQILEGPQAATEEVFESIQLDRRHVGLTLLETRPIERRSFALWSMGFCGREAVLDRLFGSGYPFDLGGLDADAMFGVLQRLALEHELRARAG